MILLYFFYKRKMENLHQADYSFPSPQEWINNAPTPSELNDLLDRLQQKAIDWWLWVLFDGVKDELFALDIHPEWISFTTNITTNIREYIQTQNSDSQVPYSIRYETLYTDKDDKIIWRTNISIYFLPTSIRMSFRSNIDGYREIPLSDVQIYHLDDIRTVLDSLLQPIREIEA